MRISNLTLYLLISKWKGARESVGSGAVRDSCPQSPYRWSGYPPLYYNCGYFHKSSLIQRTETRAEARCMTYIMLFLAGRANKWSHSKDSQWWNGQCPREVEYLNVQSLI